MDQPTLEDLLEAAYEAQTVDRRSAIHAEVRAYTAATQVCDCQPLLRLVSAADGTLTSPPVLRSVPVAWPGAGSYADTWPLAAGDIVQLLPQESDLSAWWASKTRPDPATPERGTIHTVVAVPMAIRPTSAALPVGLAYAADGRVVFAPKVYLASAGATDFVALASKVLTELQAIKTWADAHVHNDPSSGVTGAPTVPCPAPSSVAAAKVLAE